MVLSYVKSLSLYKFTMQINLIGDIKKKYCSFAKDQKIKNNSCPRQVTD